MARKKAKTKHLKGKKNRSRAAKPGRKTANKRLTPKKTAAKKKPAARKNPAKKAIQKTPPAAKKRPSSVGMAISRKQTRRESPIFDTETVELQERRSRSAGQSGDIQGLSDIESANSESVDELAEEGNAFEADVVAGVERAGDADEEEVHTHEVPQDDVPKEYLDED